MGAGSIRQRGLLLLLSACLLLLGAEGRYLLGQVGDSCIAACLRRGMNCNNTMRTGNTSQFFADNNITCKSFNDAPWSYGGPAYSPDTGECWGYTDVPHGVACQEGTGQNYARVCNCYEPDLEFDFTFGSGWSQGYILAGQETPVFAQVLPKDRPNHAAMTHFWLTPCGPDIMIRYYVDGEVNASIQFTPSLAAGVGFDDHDAPWGNELIGKGAYTGAWFWNFRVPFYKSLRVTVESPSATGIYIILRGGMDVPIKIGSVDVDLNKGHVRLVQYRTDAVFQALDFVTLADVPRDKMGIFFMHTLSFAAPNLNTLEGCYHWYSPRDTPFPGKLLSTGTEDFFDSAYYFNGGEFRLPVAGFTHLNTSASTPYGSTTFSAYRFHNEDPLRFTSGLRFVWRNGDMSDASGEKCNIETGGSPNGSPGTAHVRAYAWVYECDRSDLCIHTGE